MVDPSPSDLMEEIGDNYDAERQLKELIIVQARAAAAQSIGPDLARRVSATDVACSAADSLLSDIKHGRANPENSEELFQYACHRAKLKAINAIRRVKAGKRDIAREVSDANVASHLDSPVVQAAAREVATEIANLICQAPDEVRRCINLLGILNEFSASNIREALLKQKWLSEDQVPSVRTIQLWLAKERARLSQALAIYDDE